MLNILFGRRFRFIVLLYVALAGQSANAQLWMSGYNFRQKITIDRSKVQGNSNLLNFNVLIELQIPELNGSIGCGNGNTGISGSGLPISFAAKERPDVPMNFQADNYDPLTGRLQCWVQFPELIAGTNPGINEIYFYYGGKKEEELSGNNQSLWVNYQRVWHMNFDAGPAVSSNAKGIAGSNAIGNASMDATNFTPGVIGSGIRFDGIADAMDATSDPGNAMNIGMWIKLNQIGSEQIILTNDSAGSGCWLKINAQGKVVFEIFSNGLVSSHVSLSALPLNNWVYLVAQYSKTLKRIYINGQYSGGGGSVASAGGKVASLRIGSSKQNTGHFSGVIDELRIGAVVERPEEMLTAYNNQLHPEQFINVSAQETNPIQTFTANEFTDGNGTGLWYDSGNWSSGSLPENQSDIIIREGKHAEIVAGMPVYINGLILKPGSAIISESALEVNCNVRMDPSSSILLKSQARLIFKNDVVNNGLIRSDESDGTLVFNGAQPLQVFSGTGDVHVSHLEINQLTASTTVLLNAKISVSKQVMSLKGTLNANGNLTLLSKDASNYAMVMPMGQGLDANITGDVNVQQFIDGNFSSPSTSRGWWLMSSPVCHSSYPHQQYNLQSIKRHIFVTGPGGTSNGFDASPNNKPTIYSHNQALPGTLSQKYTGIPNMDVLMPIGKGFYVFSRGNRMDENAYLHQIQNAPFSNPSPYTLTHTGGLFSGELNVTVFNRDSGAEGDGYNLLGNPYAAPISWGKLKKLNVSPFIWVFDPRNNAYLVTDDPGYIIHTGTGFFVKVNSGHTMGTVTFSEEAKLSSSTFGVLSKVVMSGKSKVKEKNSAGAGKIKVVLKKDGLSDEYILLTRPEGNDEVTDADAQKIGEGHLSISGLATNGTKLAIDERHPDTGKQVIKLFIKGWASGTYTLQLQHSRYGSEQVTLFDHYLNKEMAVNNETQPYFFSIDLANSQTFGAERFSLILQRQETTLEKAVTDQSILCYPNPVNEILYIKSAHSTWRNLKISIRAMAGSVAWSGRLPLLGPDTPFRLNCDQLASGIYVLVLIDEKSNQTITSFKMLKN